MKYNLCSLNSSELFCAISISLLDTAHLTQFLGHIQHALPEEVLYHHLVEDPLAVSLPAPIYPHAADVRVKILINGFSNSGYTAVNVFVI